MESLLSTLNNTTSYAASTPIEHNYYDLLGRLIGTRDGNGNLTTTTYNTAGEVLSQSYPDQGSKQYVYDAFGDQIQITQQVDASDTQQTRMSYDGDGELIAEARGLWFNNAFSSASPYVLTANNPLSVTEDDYAYDGAGRRVSATNGVTFGNGTVETTRYFYDLRGLVVKATTPAGNTSTYQYDLGGNQTNSTDALGDQLT